MPKSVADMHANDEYVLRQAAYHGDYDTVKFLIQNGADVTANNNEALINAATEGHFDIVRLLIDPTYDKETTTETYTYFLDQQLDDHLEKYREGFYKICTERKSRAIIDTFIKYVKRKMIKEWRRNDTNSD